MQDTDEPVSKSFHAFPTKRPKAASPGRSAPSVSISMEDDSDEVEPPPQSPEPPIGSSIRRSAPPPTPVLNKGPASKDPDLLSVELPSGWVFYPFKELALGNIRGKHQAKFAAASKNESTRMVVETVSSLLGGNVSAAELTIPDFQFVLYQLRLNCMGSNIPLKVKGVCSNPDHILEVAEGRKHKDTLVNHDLVTRSQLKETQLDVSLIEKFREDNQELIEELEDLGFKLDAPRMMDSIELEEQFLGKPEYDSVEFLTDLIGSISMISGEPKTFQERLDIVGDLPPRLTKLLQDWQEVVQGYGVQEFINIRCKECGSDIEVAASIPAHAFF